MRVNMDSSINDEPRFKLLSKKLGIPFLHGVGCCWSVWLACYHARSERLSKDEANASTDIDGFVDAFIAVGLAHEVDAQTICVHGVEERIRFLKKQQMRGSAGGKKSRKSKANKQVATISERLSECSEENKQTLISKPTTAQANTLALALALAPALAPSQDSPSENPVPPSAGAPPPKPTPAEMEPDSDHHRFIKSFTSRWERENGGRRYPFASGKDGAAVKAILTAIGTDRDFWSVVLDRYFEDHSDFFAGHSLSKLSSQITRFIEARAPPGKNGNIATSTISEMNRFIARGSQ